MKLLKDGRLTADIWQRLADDAPIPATGAIIVPLARLEAEAPDLLRRRGPVGLVLRNSETVEAVVPHLHSLSLIVLEFPKFTDGRAYSQARLLRERHRYVGELRASGEVLPDQFLFMQRCGFDAVETCCVAAEEAWRAAHRRFSVFYQPAGDGRQTIAAFRSQSARLGLDQ